MIVLNMRYRIEVEYKILRMRWLFDDCIRMEMKMNELMDEK